MYTEVYPDRAETEAALSGVLCCSIFQIYGRGITDFWKRKPCLSYKTELWKFHKCSLHIYSM